MDKFLPKSTRDTGDETILLAQSGKAANEEPLKARGNLRLSWLRSAASPAE
jgi:hypothetical protein